MPAAIDAAVGGTSANSYQTVAVAAVYMESRVPSAAWNDATEADRIRALIMAARQIDTLEFLGDKSASGQALKWPRIDAHDDNGDEYPSNAIPSIVQQAQAEEAYRILAGTGDALANTGLEQFKRAKVGPLEVELRPTSAARMSDYTLRLLRSVVKRSGLMARLVRS